MKSTFARRFFRRSRSSPATLRGDKEGDRVTRPNFTKGSFSLVHRLRFHVGTQRVTQRGMQRGKQRVTQRGMQRGTQRGTQRTRGALRALAGH
jgi:hypothetical protein